MFAHHRAVCKQSKKRKSNCIISENGKAKRQPCKAVTVRYQEEKVNDSFQFERNNTISKNNNSKNNNNNNDDINTKGTQTEPTPVVVDNNFQFESRTTKTDFGVQCCIAEEETEEDLVEKQQASDLLKIKSEKCNEGSGDF